MEFALQAQEPNGLDTYAPATEEQQQRCGWLALSPSCLSSVTLNFTEKGNKAMKYILF